MVAVSYLLLSSVRCVTRALTVLHLVYSGGFRRLIGRSEAHRLLPLRTREKLRVVDARRDPPVGRNRNVERHDQQPAAGLWVSASMTEEFKGAHQFELA